MTAAERFRAIADRAGPRTRPLVRTIVRYAVLNPTVAELAGVLRVHPMTLQSWHARAGIPSPAQLVSLARLVITVILARNGSTAESVACDLRCSSAQSFCRWLRTQHGQRWSEIKGKDPEPWLRAWERTVEALP